MEERMIQKKVLGTRIKQRRITGRRCSSTSASTVLSALILAGLSSIKVISSCVISPSESVAIVGGRILFNCNARPNNQQSGSIAFIKLGSDGASGTDIFRPPSYGKEGQIIQKQYLAEGYFLSHLGGLHTNVIIQINETQLTHGGQYFCSCVESESKLGTANFTVLDRLSFGQSKDKDSTPGALADLNCSVSFNGSTSSAFIDLTISDANGTQVSAARNLSFISNVTGHHAIQYKVVADPKEEQRFTCEVKVWNKSSTGESLLHSLTSNFSLKPDWRSTESKTKGDRALTAVVVVAVVVGVMPLVVSVGIFMYVKRRTRSTTNGAVSAQSIEQRSPSSNQDIRYTDVNSSIQHPSHMPSQYSDQPHYESIDKERRIAFSDETYEELNQDVHSNETCLYLDIIA